VKKYIFCIFILAFNLEAKELVFVGSPFSVVESKKSCDVYVESGICMDVAFEIKYEVLEWINAENESEIIEFIGFTHSSGLPNFTSFNYALVFLKEVKGNYLVHNIIPIVELADDYILCISEQTQYKHQCTSKQTLKEYLGSL